MKLLLSFFITTYSLSAYCNEGYYTMVTDCRDFAIVNVLPTWKYYDSGVNAYITKTPASELPLVHLDSMSSSFEQDYVVTFANNQMLVEMSRFGSNVEVIVETTELREGTYSSSVIVEDLEDNFKKAFGQFANQSFICESKIKKDN